MATIKKSSYPPSSIFKEREWPLPSLRLVIVCVSLAVALTMAALIIFVDVAAPSLADIFLTTKYFPLGQSLVLKNRRWTKNKAEFEKYCSKDRILKAYGGVQCGKAVWESTATFEEGDRYVQKVHTSYKIFENESSAGSYISYYGSEGINDPLPVDVYTEVSQAPKAGEEFRAFRWDPLTLPNRGTLSQKAATTPRHILYIFRQGRTFARLYVGGFNNSRDHRLGVEFAGRLAGLMAELIEENEPSPIRKFMLNIQRNIRQLIRTTPVIVAQKVTTALQVLSYWSSKLLNSTWSSLRKSLVSQIRTLWKHLTGSSVSDLHFVGVALVVLVIYRMQILVSPYDQMDLTQVKCQSMLTSAIEKSRRQNLLNQELIFQS